MKKKERRMYYTIIVCLGVLTCLFAVLYLTKGTNALSEVKCRVAPSPKTTEVDKNGAVEVNPSTVFKFSHSNTPKICTNCASSKDILGVDTKDIGLVAAYGEEGLPIIGFFEYGIYSYSYGTDCATRSYGTYEEKNGKIYLTEKAHGKCDACIYTGNLKNYVLEISNGVVVDRDNATRMSKIKNLNGAKLSYLEDLIYFNEAENCGKGE